LRALSRRTDEIGTSKPPMTQNGASRTPCPHHIGREGAAGLVVAKLGQPPSGRPGLAETLCREVNLWKAPIAVLSGVQSQPMGDLTFIHAIRNNPHPRAVACPGSHGGGARIHLAGVAAERGCGGCGLGVVPDAQKPHVGVGTLQWPWQPARPDTEPSNPTTLTPSPSPVTTGATRPWLSTVASALASHKRWQHRLPGRAPLPSSRTSCARASRNRTCGR
jgi:hypothetical protein